MSVFLRTTWPALIKFWSLWLCWTQMISVFRKDAQYIPNDILTLRSLESCVCVCATSASRFKYITTASRKR
jgi:hypothetical protein